MLKNLRSLFIVDEEDSSDNKTEANKKEEGSKAPASPASSSSPSAPAAPISGKVNDTILNKLLKVIEDNNIDGFDYIEYKKSLQALSKMPMDEKTKYQSAFATASTMGATVPNIVKSIVHYKGVLGKEKTTFLNELKSQEHLKVSSKEKEIEAIRAEIIKKTELIKKLNEEINIHHNQISIHSKKVGEDKTKLATTKENFESTFNHLLEKIDTDTAKIKDYLG